MRIVPSLASSRRLIAATSAVSLSRRSSSASSWRSVTAFCSTCEILRMRLDWELARRGYRRYAAYPSATVAGAFTNTIFGFVHAYILLAVYRHRTDIDGYDAAHVGSYVSLEHALV